ncbi:MAG: helix-turn-helix domain-containing protein [Sciscionella sp.]
MTDFEQRRTRFGDHLRQLREDAGLTGKQLARELGWNAPKVSKLENGNQTASQDDLDAWLVALSPDQETAEQLRAELDAVRAEKVTWKRQVRAGYKARQVKAAQLEADATVIRAVEYGVVPGLLQTPDYARHVLLSAAELHGGGQDIPEAVRARMQRQQVLYEPGKTIEFLMAETALWHPIAPASVMVGQIHRLIAAIGTPNLRFGILPASQRLPLVVPHGYWIIDQVVLVETLTDETRIVDSDQVSTYNQVTDRLWSSALEGDEARHLLLRVAEQYTGASTR